MVNAGARRCFPSLCFGVVEAKVKLRKERAFCAETPAKFTSAITAKFTPSTCVILRGTSRTSINELKSRLVVILSFCDPTMR